MLPPVMCTLSKPSEAALTDDAVCHVPQVRIRHAEFLGMGHGRRLFCACPPSATIRTLPTKKRPLRHGGSTRYGIKHRLSYSCLKMMWTD